MKIWTFSRHIPENGILPRWTCRCNEADKSGVSTLGIGLDNPMSLRSCKKTAIGMGWSEDQPTRIFRKIRTESQILDHISSELNDLESRIKTPPKAGIQFS